MMASWRSLTLAAAFTVAAGVGVGTAQTVIVRNAPPGTTIELVLNTATIASATAAPSGDATLVVNLSARDGKTETDAYIYVDVCASLRRVLLVERGLQPPAQGDACSRKEMAGLFLVRQVTTMVVDLAGPSPMVWLRQGPVPKEWLGQGPERSIAASAKTPSPTGLVLFGGGGFMNFRDANLLACGNVENCAGKDSPFAYTAGAAYWFTRFLAAEASYVKSADVTADGSGSNYRFKSVLDSQVLTVAGKVGVPIGRVRIYGQAGANYHRATTSTTQTIDDSTVTVNDVTTTIKGGTQTFELMTSGWGLLFGGGVEAWVKPPLGIYVEAGRAWLKGHARDGGEGGIDDRATFILFGVRVRIRR